MRVKQSHWMRLVAFSLGLMALVALVAACAGDDENTNGGGVIPSSAEAALSNAAAAGDAALAAGSGNVLAPQATPEAPLAASVNGEPITLAEFERERARRALGMQIEPATQEAFDASVLDAMIDQLLIEQAAAELDITIGDEAVDEEIALQVSLAEANDTTLEEVLEAQLYTLDEYREVVRDVLLVQQMSEVVAEVPDSAPQVHARHILVADEAAARDLLNQLQAGADFAQLATQYSLDSSSAPSGGDLGWVPRGVLLQQEIEDAIFALEPGQTAPDPVRSSLGFHVVQTLERVEDRPLSPADVAQARQQKFLDWLETQRQDATIERFVGVVE